MTANGSHQAPPALASAAQPGRSRAGDSRAQARPVFAACAAQLRAASRTPAQRQLRRDHLRALRTRLAAALAEVDRMLGAWG